MGGIIRDIFTMGARPVALLDSLRFGSLDEPLTRRIAEGVVAGIAGYGNSIGIPTVGGEVAFDESYAGNPLVNVFCLGIARADALILGRAEGAGNAVYYVGAKTGRDGIHGATMASAEFDEKSEEKRPNVQVGDPFFEKLLLEACLEVMRTDALVGIQDMGAAGLTCSTCEMGARGGSGIEIDVRRVPQRESGMTPYEIMLSESQERMLFIVRPGREAEVERIFEKWDLHAVRIGQVTGDGLLRVRDGDAVVAEIPNKALADEAPLYDRPTSPPSDLARRQALDLTALEPPPPAEALAALLSSPQIASKRWVYRQYDHMVRTNTVVPAGMGAGVVRVKGTGRALAFAVDGNGRYCYLDPYRGAQLAVAEAARNVACAGAVPIGATNCLNFGNPERPDIMWQLARAIDGIAERALQRLVAGAAADALIEAAHDCAEGGLAVTLAECCFESGGIGVDTAIPGPSGGGDLDVAAALFGESASRVVVSVADGREAELLARAAEAGVGAQPIGRTGGARCRMAVGEVVAIAAAVAELERVWEQGLARYFEDEAA